MESGCAVAQRLACQPARARAFQRASRTAPRAALQAGAASAATLRRQRQRRQQRGTLQVVAVRVENEEVALGTVAPDFEARVLCVLARLAMGCTVYRPG
jgi:hypothetical protein